MASLTPAFTALHSHGEWQLIVGMRNRLVHAYFGTSLEIVVPTLGQRCREILDSMPAEPR